MKPTQRALAVLVGLLAVLALGFTARAAETAVTVTLTFGGPSPASANAAPGNRIVFSNTDGVTHTISATSKNWTYKKAIGANASDSVVLPSSGTYTYSDAHVVVLQNQVDKGTITVAKAAPSPSPSSSRSASPRPSTSATSKPSTSTSPSSSPTPAATPTSSTGTALGPGLGVGVLPTASPNETSGPQPNVAPPPPGTSPGTSPTPSSTSRTSYSGRGLVQGSAHRYGLPAALAVVAIAGVASLIVRLLLAHPVAARRSAGHEADLS